MLLTPNAKINIGLDVVEKRTDGYHNLQTVFYPIDITDTLSIEFNNTKNVKLSMEGYDVTDDIEDNLVVKAYRKFIENIEDKKGVDITLIKNIPFGAGLGGGSSDAAFTLMMLNEMSGNIMSQSKIEDIAQSLGADCPFFCRNKPVYAEGTGNLFTEVNLSLKDYYIVLIKPDIHVSTKEAFSGIIPAFPKYNLSESIKRPVSEWRNLIKNDFEKSVFAIYPQIGEIKDTLYNIGALYSSMSGSGSSVYGIFCEKPNIDNLFDRCFVWQGKCRI